MARKNIRKIHSTSELRVVWNDLWENYSKQKENEIIKHYKQKYNVSKVKVDFNSTNSVKLGTVNLETNEIENINAPEVQEKIILEWLKENKVDVEFSDIKRLNKRIENELNEVDVRDNKWIVEELEIENFLSYGEKTTFNFNDLKGITLITGRNFSGKSTTQLALIWLLFGQIDKIKTMDDAINKFNGATSCCVSGILVIEGERIKIERRVERVFKKRTGEYQKTISSLKFMKEQPDGSFREDDKEEQRSATEKKIRENIGTLNDFMMTVSCTGDNIFDVIKAKATERGQMLSKLLGLEIFERKLEAVKKLYSAWKIKSNIDKYNTTDIKNNIDNNIMKISEYEEDIKNITQEYGKLENLKSNLEKEVEELQSYIHTDIDNSLIYKTESDFINELLDIDNKINKTKILINEVTDKIKNDIESFNELKYNENINLINIKQKSINELRNKIKLITPTISNRENELKNLEISNSRLDGEMSTLRATIMELKKPEGTCPECGQSLKDEEHAKVVIAKKIEEGLSKKSIVDSNKLQINVIKEEINALREEINNIESGIPTIEEEINIIRIDNDTLKKQELLVKENDILKLNKDKYEVEIERLEMNKININNTLQKYLDDKDKILKNNELKNKINEKKINLTSCEEKLRYQYSLLIENNTNKDNLIKNNEELESLINELRKEEHTAKVYEIYMVMVGKNGISKSILRKSIPILNLELSKYLKDVAFFTVEVEINEKNNEVEFWLVDNETQKRSSVMSGSGYEKTIASLAIRIVNSKINTLPKPSLLFIDEIFSTVDIENLELIKDFLDKVKNSIENIFLITHNELVKEWADNIINVTKENNVTKINF